MVLRYIPHRRSNDIASIRQKRYYAVKELSWCSKDTLSRKAGTIISPTNEFRPIHRFGIVAAMSRNHIIGVNGHLPWNITEDRQDFVQLTKGKVLIIGRKTFEEEPSLSHISHVAKCIVISKTMPKSRMNISTEVEIHIVQSFPEALALARRVTSFSADPQSDSPLDMECWVAGGEGVYKVAVLHPSAQILQLTVIDMDVDFQSGTEVARFPPKYHWDTRFRQTSAIATIAKGDQSIKFTKYMYVKKLTIPYNMETHQVT
jgi:dihydrofolate reductase